MRRISFALTVLLLCALCLSACGAGIGVSYDEFVTRYTENVLFINDNTGRHLLPHTLVRDYDANGRRIYTVNKGALSMEM